MPWSMRRGPDGSRAAAGGRSASTKPGERRFLSLVSKTATRMPRSHGPQPAYASGAAGATNPRLPRATARPSLDRPRHCLGPGHHRHDRSTPRPRVQGLSNLINRVDAQDSEMHRGTAPTAHVGRVLGGPALSTTLELDSFIRVENVGCRDNCWGNLSPGTRTAFADEGDQSER